MKTSIAIIGSGPSALMLASMLDTKRFEVTIYERNMAPARKFLVAGDGGLNLTHSEEVDELVPRYTPSSFMERYIRHFDNQALRAWFAGIGIETWVGSSRRVFPRQGTKPAKVLKAMVDHTLEREVKWQFQHTFTGWDAQGNLLMNNTAQDIIVKSDIVVFALGGASWPVTGSAGEWRNMFLDKGISVPAFAASNCAYRVDWSKEASKKLAGHFLKNIVVHTGLKSMAGELVITKEGLEGGAIYALSSELRAALLKNGKASIKIDLKPSFSLEKVIEILSYPGKKTDQLKKYVRLSETQLAMIKLLVSKDDFMDTGRLAALIKAFPLEIIGAAPIDEAISTVGGVSLDEVDEHLQLKKLPNTYCMGEMLDWDAPTGGYLLQAAFSMGAYLADHLNKHELSR